MIEPGAIVAVEHVNVLAPMRAAIAGLRERGHTVRVFASPEQFAASMEQAADADVLLVSTAVRLGAAVLARLPRLRGVVFIASGTNSIDLEAATARGIVVGHSPVVENAESIAEATIMLMLATLYDLDRSRQLLRDGWQRPATPYARMLKGKTVGLIGFGAIARGVARRLAAWDVTLLYTARNEAADAAARYVTLDELLGASDIVSVHVPLSASTANLLGAERLARMKPGAILLNTSRGGIIDEAALARALAEGRLAAAAIDTFANEPIEAENPLVTARGTILTPHIVGHSIEANGALIEAAIENVIAIQAHRPPRYVRNPQVLDA